MVEVDDRPRNVGPASSSSGTPNLLRAVSQRKTCIVVRGHAVDRADPRRDAPMGRSATDHPTAAAADREHPTAREAAEPENCREERAAPGEGKRRLIPGAIEVVVVAAAVVVLPCGPTDPLVVVVVAKVAVVGDTAIDVVVVLAVVVEAVTVVPATLVVDRRWSTARPSSWARAWWSSAPRRLS